MSNGYSIGIDIGGTNIRVAKVGPSGTIEDECREYVPQDKSPEVIVGLLKNITDGFGPPAEKIGVGFAGMIDNSGVVKNSPAFGWRNVPFQEMLSKTLGRHVGLTNDMNAILLGEYNFGAAQNHGDAVCVYVGTGVGGAAMAGHRLITGSSGVSFELGHVKDLSSFKQCGCGSAGCLEAYAGGAAIAQDAERILKIEGSHAGDLDKVSQSTELNQNTGDERHLYMASKTVMDRAGNLLGISIANMCTLLNPSCLVIGGTVWEGCSYLRSFCLGVIKEKTNPPAYEALEIKPAKLGDDAGVLGASTL